MSVACRWSWSKIQRYGMRSEAWLDLTFPMRSMSNIRSCRTIQDVGLALASSPNGILAEHSNLNDKGSFFTLIKMTNVTIFAVYSSHQSPSYHRQSQVQLLTPDGELHRTLLFRQEVKSGNRSLDPNGIASSNYGGK